MSREWCEEKLKQLGVHRKIGATYSRRVVFFNAAAIKEHLAAYSEALQYSIDSSKYNELTAAMHKHQTHEPTRVFTDTEIDLWVGRRTGDGRGKGSTKANKRNK